MITDSHLHIGLNGYSEKDLLEYMDSEGIEKGWLLTWDEYQPVVPNYYIPLDVEQVMNAFRNHPDRFVAFYAPDPARPDWKERLSRFLDAGFAGCGELKIPCRWNDPLMIPLLEFLNENGLPLIFHMEQERKVFIPQNEKGADWIIKRLVNERFNGRAARFIEKISQGRGFINAYMQKRMIDFPGYLLGFDELESTVSTYTGIRFVAHGPHIWNHFSIPERPYLFHQKGKPRGAGKLWTLLKKYDNFYCDLSGFSGMNALSRNRQFSRQFLDTFHHKLLFGTDNLKSGLKSLTESLVSDNVKLDNIFYLNAQQVLGK